MWNKSHNGVSNSLLVWFCLLGLLVYVNPVTGQIPYLAKQGTATQLIVHDKPFIMLAGELHNSAASCMPYMQPVLDKLVSLRLNTVLATVSWELIEPQEGQYDFSVVDELIRSARRRDLKLVLLWFGSWKNGVSSYAPAWVRSDSERFPRALGKHNNKKNVLSPFGEQSMWADARAFAALMRYIGQVDEQENTVLMVQVENEIGIMPESRDGGPLAQEAFAGQAPAELMEYLHENKDTLLPEVYNLWERTGFRIAGTWTEVFGKGVETDEIFMAWHMASYVNTVAAAGKSEYPLPMYANAWLVQNNRQKPGDYPSGGPVSRMMDIWRAAAPQIDLLAPDIYLTEFKEVCASYTRSGNPLMIPEARKGPEAAGNVFYALAQHDAICFAPFGIETIDANHPLVEAYDVLGQLAPVLSESQGTGQMVGLLETDPEESIVLESEDYRAHIGFKMGGKPSKEKGFGLAITIGPDEFLFAGRWFSATFSSKSQEFSHAEIAAIDEIRFERGKWVSLRRLNGDESSGGHCVQLPPNYRDTFAEEMQKIRILRVRLCRFK